MLNYCMLYSCLVGLVVGSGVRIRYIQHVCVLLSVVIAYTRVADWHACVWVWRPGDLLPSDHIAWKVHQHIHLREQRPIAQLNCLHVVIVRQYRADLAMAHEMAGLYWRNLADFYCYRWITIGSLYKIIHKQQTKQKRVTGVLRIILSKKYV